MNLDLSNRKHRLIVLLMIMVPMLIIGFAITSWTLADRENQEVKKPNDPVTSPEPVEPEESTQEESSPLPEENPEEGLAHDHEEMDPNAPPLASEMFSQEDKHASKLVAEKFVQAYGNYNNQTPLDFIQNAKPYMTESFRSQWEQKPPRRPLALAKSTVKKMVTYPVDATEQYLIGWNVVVSLATINTLGDNVPEEKSMLIVLEKEQGSWKVKGVDITDG